MKIILLLNILFVYTLVNGQDVKKTYNTKIDKAKTVNVNGGMTNINKVDSVFIGQLIINEAIRTKVYLTGSVQIRDSSGVYETKYMFSPVNNTEEFILNVNLKFDKPFLPFRMPQALKSDAPFSKVSGGNNEELTQVNIFAKFTGGSFCSFTVKSKEPLFVLISGVDGKK